MGFIVQHDDVALGAQLTGHPADHLGGGLGEDTRLLPGDELGQLWRLDLLPELEGVEVGDDDLRPPEVAEPIGRDDVPLAVVALRV